MKESVFWRTGTGVKHKVLTCLLRSTRNINKREEGIKVERPGQHEKLHIIMVKRQITQVTPPL